MEHINKSNHDDIVVILIVMWCILMAMTLSSYLYWYKKLGKKKIHVQIWEQTKSDSRDALTKNLIDDKIVLR